MEEKIRIVVDVSNTVLFSLDGYIIFQSSEYILPIPDTATRMANLQKRELYAKVC
jgi:hypothetical protein